MVHNPKNSQKAMQWCAETAINWIYFAIKKAKKSLTKKDASALLHEKAKSLNIDSNLASNMLYELKRHKYIDVSGEDSVILTGKAKIKIIEKLIEGEKDDDQYRLVSFDIPEKKRTNRNQFRRAIKRMGFKQIQKSLWVTNRNVGDLVDIAAKEYRVVDYVAYFVVEGSNINLFIKKLFGISRIN
jgi:CRISPR/Cas system-associated endoribonuclease Cas2